jgi:LmbE family N-acetylglucosaminyl deacetylase
MNVLAIAPHPDDETLGCGATLLKHKSAGDSLYWLIVTRGHEPQWSEELLAQKQEEIQKVGSAYGFEKTFALGFPTVRLDTVPLEEIISAIRTAVEEAKPDCVYLNHSGDVHSDHRVVFEAVMSVLKPFYSGRHGVRKVLSYEIQSSTDAAPPNLSRSFVPNVFVDVTDYLEPKLQIMSLYETEVQPFPLPRANDSIKALARYRGSTIGAEFAEAFMLMREVS